MAVRQNGVVRRMTSEVGGMLGWLDGIRGVEIIALETPKEEQGVVVAFRRTRGKLAVPALSLQKYELHVGPATRFYAW